MSLPQAFLSHQSLIIESALPLALLLITLTISTFGPVWTLVSLAFIPISVNLMSKYFKIKDSSVFYFSFTICSILLSYLVFEIITATNYSVLTRQEYITNLVLFGLSLYSIQKTRMTSFSSSTEVLLTTSHSTRHGGINNQQMSYNYCKKCVKTIPGRDHHCIWLNTCIGKSNRYWFLATVFFSSVWLLMTILINLTSICYPVYLFGNAAGGVESGGRWFLVPFQCPDVYQNYSSMATISFVTSMYGLGILFLLILILIHQLRLLYKGVTYLEYKFGKPGGTHHPIKS